MAIIRLKEKRERSVVRRHPWIFSGAVAEVEDAPVVGATVEVHSHEGEWLARAAYSPHSQIRARIWTWDLEEVVDQHLVRTRLERAIRHRQSLRVNPEIDAFREVFAESDGLPGVIVDRYRDYRVVQFLSAGAEHWRSVILEGLVEGGDCEGVYERSDVTVRELEGLQLQTGCLWGREPEGRVGIVEYGLRYNVDLVSGQKTGFYLDQRENRKQFRSLVKGSEVLDGFSYTGGFTVAALAGGARTVLSVDASGPALELAKENVKINDLPAERCEWLEGDVFTELRRLRDAGRSFDVIVLDPPRFAVTSSQVHRATRGYKDVNLLAFKLLRPGGVLCTYSCSGGVSPELFQKIVAGAALDAGVSAAIIGWAGQPMDHPVSLNFPEGRYLKGLICRVAGNP